MALTALPVQLQRFIARQGGGYQAAPAQSQPGGGNGGGEIVLPAPNLFYDAFASGDFSAPNGPSPALNLCSFVWDGQNRTSIVTMNEGVATVINNGSPINVPVTDGRDWSAKVGANCLRFRYAAGQEMAEQRFRLQAQPDLWMRFWLRVPTNFTMGGLNNKFLSVWTGVYDGPGGITVQTRPVPGGAKLVIQDGGNSVGEADVHQDFISESRDRGRWMQFVFRAREGSSPSADDGIIQIWRRWEDEEQFTQLLDKQNANFYESGVGFSEGYLMGWANDPYSETTEFLMDEVCVSDAPLVPGV